MSKSSAKLTRLENRNARLGAEVQRLQNQIDLRNDRVDNSLGAVVGAAYGQSQLVQFETLAYNNLYAPLTLNWNLIMYMYKTHGILQAAVDMPVQDAFRGGLDLQSDELDKDDISELHEFLEERDVLTTLKAAEIWARLFGGAGLIVYGGGAPDQPLNPGRLDDLRFIAANRWELTAPQRIAPYYTFYDVKVHGSRVITISGKEAPYTLRWVLQNWGMSEFEKMVPPFNTFLLNQNAVYDLLKEAKIDVYSFEGLASNMTTAVGEQRVLRRIEIMNQAKGNGNAILLDKKDEFSQKQMTFSGLAQIWNENRINLASTMRIPMTKLFGLSASGFNSGEDDIENYNAMVESEVREHVKNPLRRVLSLCQQSIFRDEFNLTSSFKPLRILNSVDEETVRKSKHDRYYMDYQAGLLSPQEFMQLQQKEKLLPIESEVASGRMPEDPRGVQPGDEDVDTDDDDEEETE